MIFKLDLHKLYFKLLIKYHKGYVNRYGIYYFR